ncbi:Di-copper centre-containing protein [Massarina eburnea CBS 473.64]|uniref:Di-copper centre-containing protein n=1 Tax=Massarina eburnea CBS 473.64 TaxID=1395130 RepID=A0A6A6SBX8_9PLEO|nr:Di-copper centre-containing protein [Massarina eburnea CBS 473.64]
MPYCLCSRPFLTQIILSSLNRHHELKNETACTTDKIGTRKSWSVLTTQQRKEYLQAVKCIHSLPNKVCNERVPGARSRADDFTAAHINQTNFIHNSGLLLPWHRQFVWSYEKTLREECRYTGYLPYWDWSEFSHDQRSSPVFDGSDTSFGSDGAFVLRPTPNTTFSPPGLPIQLPVSRPNGIGGGCIVSTGGLPSNFTINLGPVAPANNTPDNTYGYKYNPRCLKRDFLPGLSASNLAYANVSALLQLQSIHEFRAVFDGVMHPASHSNIGGDLFDLFSSPTDPAFYLLHSQIDRLWAIWQGQDFASRTYGIDGTVTFLNLPASPNATLATVMHLFEAGGDMPISEAMSTFGGEYCYQYE